VKVLIQGPTLQLPWAKLKPVLSNENTTA